jgi:hypothetical protein
MRVRVLPAPASCALLLVGLVGLPVSAATAAPAPRTLTVRGVPNAYAEVTFAGRVRFETSATGNARPAYSVSGTYGGVYVEPVRGAGPVAGTVLLRAMPGLSDVPFPIAPQGWLPAGRYRIHLIGDAATTVRVRVEGLRRDLTVTTRTRSDVVAKWVSRGIGGVPTPADRTIVPFTVRRTTVTVVAETHESTGFYGRRDVCVRERTNGLSPCLDGNAGHGSYSGVYPLRWTLGGAAAYRPGTLPVGDLEAEFLDAAVGAPHGLTTFVMTVT